MEINSPSTARWNSERPFLTGRFHHVTTLDTHSEDVAIGCYNAAVQELVVIDDLLSAMVGIQGRYISITRLRDGFSFSMDLALFVRASCSLISSWSRDLSSTMDYQAMVAQLEHQFHLRRLCLWYYCQPMMGSMKALSTVIQKASTNNFAGSAVLNLVQTQAKTMAGDTAVRSLLEKMAECASNAYLGILERWVYDGVIDDPYGEFFIAENKTLQKESLTQDYDAKYWRQRYSLKDGIPSFLANIAGTILITGKYLNVMRECGHHVQVPVFENSNLISVGSNHRYIECINSAYDFASSELLNLIKEKYDLMGKLRSIKHYLLLDQGDFLVHFMDIARDELLKKLEDITVEKLQSLLDLALRTTAAAADPCHEDLTCCLETSSFRRTLGALKDREDSRNFFDDNDVQEPLSLTGLETFSVNYKVRWPLSIVISKKALTKYQLVFRFLFHCKHVERQLCGAWQVHQGVRNLKMRGSAIGRSSLLCRSMLKFINSLIHYLTFEVLEPNWHVMHDKLQTSKSIDEVTQHHDFFLDKCLRGCLLLLPEFLKKVERLKALCLQYASATQWLISSILAEKPKHCKSRSRCQALSITSCDTNFTDAILKFEKEFNAELQSLAPILSSSSQAEPYLTRLAQWILGTGNDQ